MNDNERYLLNHCYQHAIEHENQKIYEMSKNEIVWNYTVYKKTGVLIEPDDWKDSFDTRNEEQNRKDEKPEELNSSKITNKRKTTGLLIGHVALVISIVAFVISILRVLQ